MKKPPSPLPQLPQQDTTLTPLKKLTSSLRATTTAYIPIIKWLPKYQYKQSLKGDFVGAITIAMLILPQTMAYAQMANLPVAFGLYSSFFPMMVYAIFGTSPHISVGPVTLNSLLYATMVGQFYDPETQRAQYIQGVATMTLYVGLIGIGFGILRLGNLVNYISPGVMTGFTTAYVIVTSIPQFPKLLGYKIRNVDYPWQEAYEIARQIHHLKWQPLVFGIVTGAIIVLVKKWKPLYPGPLIATAFTTSLCAILGQFIESALPEIVGAVPKGLPNFVIPAIASPHIVSLLPNAAVLCFLGYMQSIAAAKKYAEIYVAEIDANKELIALGLATVGGTFFGGLQPTGAFGRTAVGVASGSRTQMTSFITGTIIIICLCGITPLFYYIPQSALAAVILVATFPLIDPSAHIRLWKASTSDGFVALVTTLAICGTTVPFGFGAGIVVSVLVPLARTSWSSVPPLGEFPHTRTGVWKEMEIYPEVPEH